jgi:hypothetical protein
VDQGEEGQQDGGHARCLSAPGAPAG